MLISVGKYDTYSHKVLDMKKKYFTGYKSHNLSYCTMFITAITIKFSLGVRFLTSESMVDEKYSGQVVGLMGNFDGNSTNDFILPNGTILYGSEVDTERGIYNNFGQLCEYMP